MSAPKKHSWGDPERPNEHKTERVCRNCGVIKVSHHEGDSHWIDFWKIDTDGNPERISSDKTPPCGVPFDG